MSTHFSQSETDLHVSLHLANFPRVDTAALARIELQYRRRLAEAPLMNEALDKLTAIDRGLWTVVWGDYGPGRYPLSPALVEPSCYCSGCQGRGDCDTGFWSRSIRTYGTRSIAQSAATRLGNRCTGWYLPVRLPRAVVDTTQALLKDPCCERSSAFRTAVLLAT